MLYMSSDEPTQLNERTNLEKSYTFEGEDYYKEKLAEGQADLQPGESFSFTMPENIVKGKYEVSVVSCGNRTKIGVAVGDNDAAYIVRNGNGFGMNQETTDQIILYYFLIRRREN